MRIARRWSASAASRSCPWSSSTTAPSCSTRCRSSRCSRSAIRRRRCIRADFAGRARDDALHRLVQRRVEGRAERDRGRDLGRASPTSARIDVLAEAMAGALDVFEKMLDGRSYLLGDEFSAADCAAYPFLKYALWRDPADDELFHRVLDSYQQLGDDHPRLAAWIERHRRAPAGLGGTLVRRARPRRSLSARGRLPGRREQARGARVRAPRDRAGGRAADPRGGPGRRDRRRTARRGAS